MIMMDDALVKLYKDGVITKEEALGRAIDRGTLKANIGA
jgi:Tfp pilus assembly ATPase PilU